MTKYYRKTLVDAVQWTGDNPDEVWDFLSGNGQVAVRDYGNVIEFEPAGNYERWENVSRVYPGQWLVHSEDYRVSVYPDDIFKTVFGEYKDE